MSTNNTVSMYEAVPVVSELNKVPGFDPLKFLRRTKDGGWKMDQKIKRLWFKLKYPNSMLKLSALKITDQLAIIEARVYFDRNDAQPAASFTARRENKTTPGGLYIEAAQHAAIDEALSMAGFGLQFIPAEECAPVPVERKASVSEAAPETDASEPLAEALPPKETAAVTSDAAAVEDRTPAPESASVPVQVEAVPAAEPEQEEPAEVPESVESSCAYTKDMSVEEICARMSVEEAGNIIVSAGTCKGWTLSQVADRRPVSLKWYLTGYRGDDNILRAGALIMQRTIEAKKAG